jgi:hypothetical protein
MVASKKREGGRRAVGGTSIGHEAVVKSWRGATPACLDVSLARCRWDIGIAEVASATIEPRNKHSRLGYQKKTIVEVYQTIASSVFVYTHPCCTIQLFVLLPFSHEMTSKVPSQQLESNLTVNPSQIFIKSLTGSVIVVSTSAHSTVGDVMSNIESREGIQTHLQRLTFAGKQLQPKFCLADYNIQSESTLHLSSRLLGGMPQWQQIIVYISAVIFGVPIFAKLKQLIMQQIAMITAAEEWDEEGGEAEQ